MTNLTYLNKRRQPTPQLQFEEVIKALEKALFVFVLLRFHFVGRKRLRDDAFVLEPPFGEHFAELLHQRLVLGKNRPEHILVNFEELAIGNGADGRGSSFAGEERHFAAILSLVQGG